MSKDFAFSVMPSVSISRSRFARKSQHKTSFNLGSIVPIYVDEVLPGDTRSIDMASLVRMSTPIAPIMDNIYIDFYAFFVPNRLVWTHWKEFMGENNASAGIPVSSYNIPYLEDQSGEVFAPDSIGAYFGLPMNMAGIMYGTVTTGSKISALPFRGYALIYNEWFRNQNVEAPLAIQTGDINEVIVGELTSEGYSKFAVDDDLLTAYKLSDYFTTSLPYAQKGAAVSIPLGTTAPIIGAASMHSVGTNGLTMQSGSLAGNSYLLGLGTGEKITNYRGTAGTGTASVIDKTNMVADLSTATAATINQLRYAFQLQKFLEKDALYGSRYWEILAAHFGIKAPDATLQRPEFLGGHRIRVNVDQVLTTAGYDDGSSQEVGKPGANSVTGSKMSLFTKSFVEHGYLFILAVARQDHTYCQGINRMWTRQSRYDFYFPVFANLGAQEVKIGELFAGSNNHNTVFGYQEAWAEYRYKPSIATGMLSTQHGSSLNYWTLTDNFGSAPTLGPTFLKENRSNIKRVLVTGATGPDFIADFYFEDIAVRPMPMYSIPGLIDHH